MRVTLTLAWFTLRDLSRQGYTLSVVGFAAGWIAFSQFLPMFLGEEAEVRLVMDVGLATILLAGAALTLLPAGTALGDELESRTALMLLPKPIARSQYLHGRLLGILGMLAVATTILGGILLWVVRAKRLALAPGTAVAWLDADVLWGVLLIGTQVAVLTVLCLSLSNLLPLAANLCLCVALTAAGYLSDHLAGTLFGEGAVLRGASWGAQWDHHRGAAIVEAVRGIAPNFGLFNLNDAIAAGTPIPPAYAAATLAYSLALGAAYLGVGTWLFERKDVT